MTDEDGPKLKISIVRVEPAEKPYRGYPDGFMVTFEIEVPNSPVKFEVPIFVSTDHFDEVEMVKVARHYLHRVSKSLESQTSEWDLPAGWIEKHRKDGKKDP